LEDTSKIIEWWQKDQGREARLRRRKIIRLAILGIVLILLILVGFYFFTDFLSRPIQNLNSNSKPQEWAMFGRDLSHASVVDAVAPEIQGKVTRILSTGEIIHSSPVVAGNLIYVGSRNGIFYALNRDTGEKVWEFATGSWVESSPAVVNETVYFGSNDGFFYALDALTGKKLWDFHTKYPVKSSPAVVENMVYFGCDDFSIYAVNAVNGKLVWKVETSDSVSSSPVVANGIVYAGSMDGFFYAIDARSGRVRLRFPTNRPIISSPVVKDETVFFNTSNGILYAIDGKAKNWLWENKIRPNWMVLYLYGAAPQPPPPSGFLWTINFNSATTSSPVISGNNLFLGIGTRIVSVDINSHTKQWEFAADRLFSSPPIVLNERLYAANENGHLYILDANSGSKLMDIQVGGKITSLPVIAESTIYISSEDGNLYAIN